MTEPQEAGVMFIWDLVKGGVVHKSEVASKIAELLLAAHYGGDELEQQRPLVVTDQTDTWLVEGSRNTGRNVEGGGPARAVISKRDGRILDFSVPEIRFAHPDIRDILRKPQG